jgi:thiol:disulfide interchange protein DsbC
MKITFASTPTCGLPFTKSKRWQSFLLAAVLAITSFAATGQEDVIRKKLAERIPQLGKIEEIKKSPIVGLFEIRVGASDIYYTDAAGNYLIDGQLVDTKTGKNLTEERVNKLTAIDFKDLPLGDAIVIKRGTGARKIAVFTDPNCGYCKRFEADLLKVNNITVYNFLYPVLGADSLEKSKNVWCAADKAKTWQDWMLNEIPPKAAPVAKPGVCNVDAISRIVEFGKKNRITGTPMVLLADGTRIPGAINSAQLEKRLAEIKVN